MRISDWISDVCSSDLEHRIEPSPGKRAELEVISGLPLFWRENGVKADAPIITVLRQRFDVRPVDSPLALEKGGAGMLLLAQPRAFSLDAQVALDAWKIGRASCRERGCQYV